jgi:hypothetical protein
MSASIGTKGLWTSLVLIVACATCCALPLLSVLGIGAIPSAAVATFRNSEANIIWGLHSISRTVVRNSALAPCCMQNRMRA